MGWQIDRDHLNEKWNREGGEYNSESRAGTKGKGPVASNVIRFRLKDDDEEVYYSGRLHDDDECENQLRALEFGTMDAGCTIIEVKRFGQWQQEIS